MDIEILYLLSASLKSQGHHDDIKIHFSEEVYDALYEKLKLYNIEKTSADSFIYFGPHGKVFITKRKIEHENTRRNRQGIFRALRAAWGY